LKNFKIFILLFAALFTFQNKLFCQENPEPQDVLLDTVPVWRKAGTLRLNFSQIFLENWIAGGQSSFSAASLLDFRLNYKKRKRQWESLLELGYGFMQNQNEGFFKTDDKISIVSNYSYQAINDFNYSFLMSFRSQFAPGYSTPGRENLISDFLAPGFFIASVGMNYKKDKLLTIVLSPLTARFTIVANPALSDAGAFGVVPGRRVREEIGSYFKGILRKENLFENVTVQMNLDLFSNYLEEPENIDVNWETLIVMKVNRYLSANVSTHLIYDHDIKTGRDTTGDGIIDRFSPSVQFKEVLSLGLSIIF
jgi:hypothetical protein